MDSSEIVSQVMKIRDSLKTASSLLIALGKQPDSEVEHYIIDVYWLLLYFAHCALLCLTVL